jgi:hypothetical protein
MSPSRTLFACTVTLLSSFGCARKTEPHDAAAPPKDAPAAAAPESTKPDIVQEFNAFVAERNACNEVSECVLLSPGCPLGCGVGVRKEHADEVTAKAKALIAEAEKDHGACTYKCMALHVECSAGRCTSATE